MTPEVGWELRKTLQCEPRIFLLGSATSRFAEIDNSKRALYDLFQVHTLKRLDTEACATLWRSVSERDIAPRDHPLAGNPYRRQPPLAVDRRRVRLPALLPRVDGRPPEPGRRSHRVLPEPSGGAGSAGATGLLGAGRPLAALHGQPGLSHRPAFGQPLQRGAETPGRSG